MMDKPEISLNLSQVLKEVNQESDRAAALLMAANIDNRLITLVTNFLVDDGKLMKALTKGFAPLSTFSARINFAYALGFLSVDEHNDLDMIREVRNDFAHEEHGWSFSHPEIVKWCNKLRLPKQMAAAGGLGGFDISNSRNAYVLACIHLSATIQVRASEASQTRRTVRAHVPFRTPS